MKITSTSCICPVLVCLCFVQRCYGTTHHSSIKGTRNQTKHIEGETEVHHRPKRGWVWNQFFVLEEHMGPDPQYVGKVSFCLLFVFSSPGKLWGVIRSWIWREMELQVNYVTECYFLFWTFWNNDYKKWMWPSMSHLHKHQFVCTRLNFLYQRITLSFSHVKCKHFKHTNQ